MKRLIMALAIMALVMASGSAYAEQSATETSTTATRATATRDTWQSEVKYWSFDHLRLGIKGGESYNYKKDNAENEDGSKLWEWAYNGGLYYELPVSDISTKWSGLELVSLYATTEYGNSDKGGSANPTVLHEAKFTAEAGIKISVCLGSIWGKGKVSTDCRDYRKQ